MNHVTVTFDKEKLEDGYIMETDVSDDAALIVLRAVLDNHLGGKCNCKSKRHRCKVSIK